MPRSSLPLRCFKEISNALIAETKRSERLAEIASRAASDKRAGSAASQRIAQVSRRSLKRMPQASLPAPMDAPGLQRILLAGVLDQAGADPARSPAQAGS